jgi:hypothetical protein
VLLACFAQPIWAEVGPTQKNRKIEKKIKKTKKKMCVCINKKNKYEFVIFIH